MQRHAKEQPRKAAIDWAALRPPVTDALLADITRRIVERFQPHKVVLFGSYADGTPDLNSDVDLLVIMDSEEPMARRITRVAAVARVRFLPMDVLVYTPEEIEGRLTKGDFFIVDILARGRVLYQRNTGRGERGRESRAPPASRDAPKTGAAKVTTSPTGARGGGGTSRRV
jgi:predicted nucleotidyltransferase